MKDISIESWWFFIYRAATFFWKKSLNFVFVRIPPRTGGGLPMLYTYDQLNRLVAMDAFKGINGGSQLWDNGLTATTEWKENISYDANGNILTYNRNGDKRSAGAAMDQLHYKPNTNQLLQVTDDVTAATPADYNDIKSQTANNYDYDEIGSLTKDVSAGIGANGISWSVYGKILQINPLNWRKYEIKELAQVCSVGCER